MAVKKKSAVKKTAAKKSAAKKSVAKKSTAKKAVAKKSVKKSAVKKSAVKKSAVKKSAVKKSATKKRAVAASAVVIPPVPSSSTLGASRVDVTSAPKPVSTGAGSAAKSPQPTAPKQGASGKVLAAIIVGVILLAVIVVTRPDGGSDDASPAATPTASASTMPSEEPSAEPTVDETTAPVTAVEGPKTIGNWKDAAKSIMEISWKAPTASAGLTGYKVEVRVNRGEWAVKSEVPADQLAIEFNKTDSMGETAFRVSSIYSDGQEAVGNTFGFSGVFE